MNPLDRCTRIAYTAACPGCGADTTWTVSRDLIGAGAAYDRTGHISIGCGCGGPS